VPVAALQDLADMPVAGMQDPHRPPSSLSSSP
jgi:hypothetical protein